MKLSTRMMLGKLLTYQIKLILAVTHTKEKFGTWTSETGTRLDRTIRADSESCISFMARTWLAEDRRRKGSLILLHTFKNPNNNTLPLEAAQAVT